MKSEQLEQLYENTIVRMLELLGDASAADALYVMGELITTIIEGAAETKLERIAIANKFCQCLIASIMDVEPDNIQTLTLFDAPPDATRQ